MASDPSLLLRQLVGTPDFASQLQAYQGGEQDLAAGKQNLALGGLKLQAAQRQMQQDQAYQQAASAALADGSPQAIASLITRFPDRHAAVAKGWEIKDNAQKTADLRSAGEVLSALDAGKHDVAAASMQARIAAEEAAGQDTTQDKQVLAAIRSGDQAAINAARGALRYTLSAVVPEKFTDVLKATGGDQSGKTHVVTAGGALVDDTGKELYRAAEKPEYRTIKNADGTESLVAVGGGEPASGSSQPLATRLNNPGAIRYDSKNDWQGQVGEESGFVKFATPEAGAAAHRKLIANQIKAGYDTPLEWAKHYAPASDGNDPTAYATTIAKGLGIALSDKIPLSAVPKMASLSAAVESGGTPAPQASGVRTLYTSQGGKPGYRFLTPAEKSERGLPANVAFQVSPDGKVEAPSGQDTRTQQAQAVPASAQKSILENHSTIREIDRAIALLEKRPQSIGFGTGAMGDWFTQRNDPEGTPVRAAIGKIGGKIIHDMSGAAVTMSEAPRFQPYVPMITDSAQTAINKLKQMKQLAEADQGDLVQAYGPENGYRGVKLPGQQAPVKVTSVQQAMKLAPGTLYIRPDGKVMRR